MTTPLATALALSALLAVAPTKPLFDKRPATIDGVRYGPEKVYEGDYTAGFETRRFVPIGGKAGDGMWLEGWSPEVASDANRTYHIRFIGRRTVKAGGYGHLGAYRHIVLVTDIIDARPKP